MCRILQWYGGRKDQGQVFELEMLISKSACQWCCWELIVRPKFLPFPFAMFWYIIGTLKSISSCQLLVRWSTTHQEQFSCQLLQKWQSFLLLKDSENRNSRDVAFTTSFCCSKTWWPCRFSVVSLVSFSGIDSHALPAILKTFLYIWICWGLLYSQMCSH